MNCVFCRGAAQFKETQSNVLYCDFRCQQGHHLLLNGKKLIKDQEKKIHRDFLDKRPRVIDLKLWQDIVDLERQFSSKGTRDIPKLVQAKDDIRNRLEKLILSHALSEEIEQLERTLQEEREREKSILSLIPLDYNLDLDGRYNDVISYFTRQKDHMLSLQERYRELKARNEMNVVVGRGERMKEIAVIQKLSKFLKQFDKHYESLVQNKQEDGTPEVIEGMTANQQDVFENLKESAFRLASNTPPLSPFKLEIMDHIKRSQIVMHLPLLELLPGLIANKDRYLRNLFETGKGRGHNDKTVRAKWEKKIFKSSKNYDLLNDHQKVKYASLNLAQAPHGVKSLLKRFGGVYLIMESVIKTRSTITPADSSLSYITSNELATFFRMEHIIQMYKDFKTFDEFIELSDDKVFGYMDVQIHGELRFDRDVKEIMVCDCLREKIEPLLEEYFKVIGKRIEVNYFEKPADID